MTHTPHAALIAAILGASALVGCATQHRDWHKADATPAQVAQDKAECQLMAKAGTDRPRISSQGSTTAAVADVVADSLLAKDRRTELTNDCMKVRGYRPG